jgi:hypothetical protein
LHGISNVLRYLEFTQRHLEELHYCDINAFKRLYIGIFYVFKKEVETWKKLEAK